MGSVNDCDGDGISSSFGSFISFVLIKSSEIIVFNTDWSVGKGSPGWTLREPMVHQTNNKKSMRKKIGYFYLVEWY